MEKEKKIRSRYRKRTEFPNSVKTKDINFYSDLQGDAKKRPPVSEIKMWEVTLGDK